MDYNEYKHCIHILKKKTPFLLPQKTIQAKLRCLDTFKEVGAAYHISSLLPFLRESNQTVRYKVAETIIHLLHKLRTLYTFYESLKYLEITTQDVEYYSYAFPQDSSVYLWAIASCNANGYVREKAVVTLSSSRRPEAIPYLLLRLGDWVEPVREATKTALRSFFHDIYRKSFFNQLTVVEWLARVERANLQGIQEEIYTFVVSEELTEKLYKERRKIGDKIWLIYVRQYLQRKGLNTTIVQLLQTDKNFLVRIELLRYLSQLNSEQQQQLCIRFLADRSAKVRLAALYEIAPSIDTFLPTVLKLLSDSSASVRHLSRFLLREKHINFADIYRRRLGERGITAGDILGLSEVGTKEDILLFQKYISEPDTAIQLACLVAIHRIDPVLAKSYCVRFLSHPSRNIRDKCFNLLATRYDVIVVAAVRSLYKNGNEKQRKTALRFFSRVGGWPILSDLLQSLLDDDEDIQNLGWNFLQRWKDRSVRLFTLPAPADLERAVALYQHIDTSKTALPHFRKKLWTDISFFLHH